MDVLWSTGVLHRPIRGTGYGTLLTACTDHRLVWQPFRQTCAYDFLLGCVLMGACNLAEDLWEINRIFLICEDSSLYLQPVASA